MRGLLIVFCCALGCFAPFLNTAAQAVVYYVATTGSDSNAGTESEPFKTIQGGIRVLKPGDILSVKGGLYEEELARSIPPGTDWDHPVMLKGYDPQDRPVLRPLPGAERVITFGTHRKVPQQYIVVDGFVLDGGLKMESGEEVYNVKYDAVKITDGANHIRIANSEIMHGRQQGILVTDPASTHNEFIHLQIHDNGTLYPQGKEHAPDFLHGVYISTSDNLVEGCEVYRNAGWGIHVYSKHPEVSSPSFNIVRDNKVHDNARWGKRGMGIGLYSGPGNQAVNNLVWGNAGGIAVDYGALGTKVLHNVVYRNRGPGILIGKEAAATEVLNNIVSENEGIGVRNFGSVEGSAVGTVIKGNLFFENGKKLIADIHDPNKTAVIADNIVGKDPLFVDAPGRDFHLAAGSPARGAAVSDGTASDIGIFDEFKPLETSPARRS